MDKDESSIRNEDIRIVYNDDVKRLTEALQREWRQKVYEQFGLMTKT